MSTLHLTPGRRHRLRQQLAATEDVRLFRRTLAILESDYGRSAADIARMLGVSRQTVYNWLEAYTETGDPAALEDHRGRGHYLVLDEDADHLVEALLARSPQELGYPHAGWTVPLLREALALAPGQQVSEDTVRRTLRRLEFVWKRPRYDFDPDPQREKKTPHPPANPGLAAAQRRAGRRRDRPVAVPAAARRLVEAR
jgi:transposase